MTDKIPTGQDACHYDHAQTATKVTRGLADFIDMTNRKNANSELLLFLRVRLRSPSSKNSGRKSSSSANVTAAESNSSLLAVNKAGCAPRSGYPGLPARLGKTPGAQSGSAGGVAARPVCFWGRFPSFAHCVCLPGPCFSGARLG